MLQKHLFKAIIMVSLVFACGCGGDHAPSPAANTSQPAGDNAGTNTAGTSEAAQPAGTRAGAAAPEPPASAASADSIVFAGAYAVWTNVHGSFSGCYDSLHHLFMACNSKDCKSAPIGEIAFKSTPQCGEPGKNIYFMRKNGIVNGESGYHVIDDHVVQLDNANKKIMIMTSSGNKVKEIVPTEKEFVHLKNAVKN